MGVADKGEYLSCLTGIMEENILTDAVVPPNLKLAVAGLTIPVFILYSTSATRP
jgi:hypothetical protein